MTFTTTDGTQIYFKDCGQGPPVVFCHGWPLTADAWEGQMVFLGQRGYASSPTTGAAPSTTRPPRTGWRRP